MAVEGDRLNQTTYSTLVTSKYFNPAFNSAIFDGPVRIYFSQAQEALALKVYFLLQKNFAEKIELAKELHKNTGSNILVMMYPNQEAYQMSFDEANLIGKDRLQEDFILGVNGPVEDEKLSEVTGAVIQSIDEWSLSQKTDSHLAFL